MVSETPTTVAPARHRPKSFTVFAAAFIAGAAAAVGVNRVLDVQLAQRRPQVECEPIFVALRPLPQGAPVTVWDVALKDWPKAMLPSSALRAGDTFEGCVLRHAVREGQPLLSVQLAKSGAAATGSVATEAFTPPVPAGSAASPAGSPQTDPWMPGESLGASVPTPPAPAAPTAPAEPAAPTTSDIASTDLPRETAPEIPAGTATDVTAATTSPAVTPVEQPAAAHVTTEPTPIEPPTAAAATVTAAPRPMPPSPATIEPPVPSQPTIATTDDPDRMSEAVATDVQSMPSVMKAVGQPIPPPATRGRGDAGRYLVVPERIALQADTSFTTPRPQPPGPPATATSQAAAGARPSAAATPPVARGTPPQRPQTARVKQPQRTVQPQRAVPPRQPTPPAATAPSGGSRDQQKQAAGPRAWGGMFPNVAAGLEAISGPWQRSKSASEPAAPPTRR